ncbi:DUF58 domain-containing protein [Methylocaldum sp.]|uniref:DUF58 domain-containing protein n=1 Tax=Methylocaldum sp. TaxID=1969727 RepID=UPI00322043D7
MATFDLDECFIDEPTLRRLASVAGHLFRGRAAALPGRRPRRSPTASGNDFLGYRDYRAGDDLRALDWRASARAWHPQVKQFGSECSTRWFICLDRSASMRLPESGKWALASHLTAAFAYVLLHAGNRVGLIVFSGGIDTLCASGSGREQYTRLLDVVRRCRPREEGGGSNLAACIPALRADASVLVISDLLTEDGMRPALDLLLRRGHEVQVVQTLSAEECTLHRTGPTLIRDVENGVSLPVDASESGRAAAQTSLNRFRESSDAYCRRRGIPFSSCETSRTWDRWLIDHIGKLEASND